MKVHVKVDDNNSKYKVNNNVLDLDTLYTNINKKINILTLASSIIWIVAFWFIGSGMFSFGFTLAIIPIIMEFIFNKITFDLQFEDSSSFKTLLDKFSEVKSSTWSLGLEDSVTSFTGKFSKTENQRLDVIQVNPNQIAWLRTLKKENKYAFMYLLPDHIAFSTGPTLGGWYRGKFNHASYDELTIECDDTISIDFGNLQGGGYKSLNDTFKFEDTYLHVNKDGSRDRRRANNHKIQVFHSSRISFEFKNSSLGKEPISGQFSVSNRKAARDFVLATGKALGCKTKINSVGDWEACDHLSFILVFIAGGVDMDISEEEQKMLTNHISQIFSLKEDKANESILKAFSYYCSVKFGSSLADTRRAASMEYLLALETFKKLGYENRDKIYKIAEEIAGADGVIDEGEEIYLKAMKKTFGISVKASKEQKSESAVSKADEIEKFAKLRDKGVLTDEEYEAKKKELLGL